jgi:hypothetical protein
MAEDPDKSRPVQLRHAGHVTDRTNNLRIQKDVAQRLIARYLRENKMMPGDANELSNRIIDGIVSNMPVAGRPGLRGFRMIPEHPPEDVCSQVAAAFRTIRPQENKDWSLARDVWDAVYRHGTAIPDDVVL